MATEVTLNDSGETATCLLDPPWRVVPGICNFRDIGGYPIEGGKGSVASPFLLLDIHHFTVQYAYQDTRFEGDSSTVPQSPQGQQTPEKPTLETPFEYLRPMTSARLQSSRGWRGRHQWSTFQG